MPEVLEICAGVVLVRRGAALLIRVRRDRYELPKGHVEAGESLSASAVRELREETGLLSPIALHGEVGTLDYAFERNEQAVRKRVHCFAAFGRDLQFGPRPRRTRELHWVTAAELETIPLVNEAVRPLIAGALQLKPAACP